MSGARESTRAEGGGSRSPGKELDITPRPVRSCWRTFSGRESTLSLRFQDSVVGEGVTAGKCPKVCSLYKHTGLLPGSRCHRAKF